jgi:MFS family permease
MGGSLLETRDGRRLLAAQAITFAAHGIASVALPWLILDEHGSSSAAGLVFTFTTLPYVVFAVAAGVVGDRYPSRRVIWVTHSLQALLALVVPLWALSSAPPVAIVLVAAFLVGAGRAFSDAAVFGALASLVGRERLVHAQATLSASWAVGLLAGPAIGGVLVAAIGPARSLAVEATGLAVAAVIVRMTRLPDHAERNRPADARAIVRDGAGVIAHDPVLRRVTILGMGWAIASAGAWALAVPLLRDVVGLDSTETGIALAVGAIMGVVAPPIVARLEPRFGGVAIVLAGVPLTGIAVAALGYAGGFVTALLAFAAFQLVDYVSVAAYIGERQRRAPLRLQATVGIFGRTLIMLSLALGSAVASGLAEIVPLRPLYAGMAVATVLVGLAGIARLGSIRKPAGDEAVSHGPMFSDL